MIRILVSKSSEARYCISRPLAFDLAGDEAVVAGAGAATFAGGSTFTLRGLPCGAGFEHAWANNASKQIPILRYNAWFMAGRLLPSGTGHIHGPRPGLR